MLINIKKFFPTWSALDYGDENIDAYARKLIEAETRRGLFTMSLTLIVLLCSAIALSTLLDLGTMYVFTYVPLSALCLHILISTNRVRDVEVQQLLAIVLLVICSTAFVLLAHKTGRLSAPILAGVALLFIVVPLMPWGLREAFAVTSLIYLVFTLSTMSVTGKFDSEVLLLLQFFMLSAASITLVVIARNTSVRRKEILSLYDLENAHARMRELSYKDPLTGAWNRRYLQDNFHEIVLKHRKARQHFYFVLFDLNNFKQLNDTLGHDYGDMVLKWLTSSLTESLGEEDLIVRMGGDEFAMVIGDEPKGRIQKGSAKFVERLSNEGGTVFRDVTVTYGLMRVDYSKEMLFSDIYKAVDKGLYKGKGRQGNCIVDVDLKKGEKYSVVDFDVTGASGNP